MSHGEMHRVDRAGWLRAAALGANDGLMSTASLMVGIAAGNAQISTILLAGIASMVAGATSMAAGEYISVSSQSDIEQSDLKREKMELTTMPERELLELKSIYISRGLDEKLAEEVAIQMTQHNALQAHARDELGITTFSAAKPLQAAFSSAAAFVVGSLLPILIALVAQKEHMEMTMTIASLIGLALLGTIVAKMGATPLYRGALRTFVWGSVAIFISAMVGKMLGQVV
jgi:VIT1/CCC1 family predicted Fe2+/Mn2+ transporter